MNRGTLHRRARQIARLERRYRPVGDRNLARALGLLRHLDRPERDRLRPLIERLRDGGRLTAAQEAEGIALFDLAQRRAGGSP